MTLKDIRSQFLAAAALVALAGAGALQAAPVKLATLVPEGSIWDRGLRDMGADWQKATNGQQELRIYPGGVAGDEPDIVRKMRIGQLHAASLSVTGLIAIDKSFEIFQIPMFFRSWEELDYVIEGLQPELEKRLAAKGYVFLQWGHGGWVHLFSRQPVRSVPELQKQKIFTWAGNDMMVNLWRGMGFQPVALAATDILTGLQTGMIDVVPTTPLAALTLQWFRTTPNMLDEGLAPLVGATVITQKAWDGLSAEAQASLRAAAAKTGQRFATEIPAQDKKAIEQMKGRGLNITSIEAAGQAEWVKISEGFSAKVGEQLEDKAMVAAALKLRTEFRAKKP
jgi:TRAP-type C4-dicarboxylate transport system substrate-binding protein